MIFFLLTIRDLTGNMTLFGDITIGMVAGFEGIICGSSAVYLALAEVLNEANKKTVLPICPVE